MIPSIQIVPSEVSGYRGQVVRNRKDRQGDHDQVVEQDHPARDEGDQLVERMARKRGGPAPLAQHRPTLEVCEHGQHEEQPGGEEDQGGETETALGHHPEGEVDRKPDRGIGDDQQPERTGTGIFAGEVHRYSLIRFCSR